MEIEPGVYRLECTKGAWAYAVREADGVTLVDTGVPGKSEAILKELAARGIHARDVTLILLTHCDLDHAGSAAKLAKLCKCPVLASAEELAGLCGGGKTSLIRKPLLAVLKRDLAAVLRPLPEGNVGGIRVIPAPGHTPGHCCFQYGDVLFAGDLVRTADTEITSSPWVFTTDGAVSDESAWGMDMAAVKWICPGHGHPVLAHPAWEEYLAVLRGREIGPARR